MSGRTKVLLISAVAMFLGWVEITEETDFVHTLTHDPPLRLWLGLAVAVVLTVGFPLWRLRQKYSGFWQEAVIGLLGSWLMFTSTLVIIGVAGHLGWPLLFTPVLFTGALWIAQEMDAQKQQRDGAGEPSGKTA